MSTLPPGEREAVSMLDRTIREADVFETLVLHYLRCGAGEEPEKGHARRLVEDWIKRSPDSTRVIVGHALIAAAGAEAMRRINNRPGKVRA